MRIRKEYFVIYDNKRIISFGKLNDRFIETSQVPYAEFDSESEMLKYIKDNKLEYPDEVPEL